MEATPHTFVSVFDLFKIGIGPSSSHTVGPMRAANLFVGELDGRGVLPRTARVVVSLFGSLGVTGKGHCTDKGVILGLEGYAPESVPADQVDVIVDRVAKSGRLRLNGGQEISFPAKGSIVFHRNKSLPYHPNGMHLVAIDASEGILLERIYYSVGGGFVVREDEVANVAGGHAAETPVPHPFSTSRQLLDACNAGGMSISDLMLANELSRMPADRLSERLDGIWSVMCDCVRLGCTRDGILPGGLRVRRRAKDLYLKLRDHPEESLRDPLTILDWVNLYALAVNEENAAGGRVVTAPTNGAAGIIPAVLHYATRFCHSPHDDGVHRFLLASAAVGSLYKCNASISGADVGCQGEVGVACSMAAAGLVEYLGGTPRQVENAAEIGMEHNLGLTCDPIGGLVQIPCIERNAMASVKAINAARMAMRGSGEHFVSLDKVIHTMLLTGRDMHAKYKETSRGGLAVNLVEC